MRARYVENKAVKYSKGNRTVSEQKPIRGKDMIAEDVRKEISAIVDGKLSPDEIEKLTDYLREAMTKSLEEDSEDFYRRLTSEMSGGVKELAMVLIDFRREFKSRLHPNITDIATKHIPEAADQLEGVIETTENAANRVMDNLEGMEKSILGTKKLFESLRNGRVTLPGGGNGGRELVINEGVVNDIIPLVEFMESSTNDYMSLITDSFTQMSFQDLTGQRIKRIIKLVSVIEEKIKGMIISFGIKVNEKEKNPEISHDELQRVVEEKVEELSGPQRKGMGLDQAGIDDLLANL